MEQSRSITIPLRLFVFFPCPFETYKERSAVYRMVVSFFQELPIEVAAYRETLFKRIITRTRSSRIYRSGRQRAYFVNTGNWIRGSFPGINLNRAPFPVGYRDSSTFFQLNFAHSRYVGGRPTDKRLSPKARRHEYRPDRSGTPVHRRSPHSSNHHISRREEKKPKNQPPE